MTKILITAGMDADEYVGMRAAKDLIRKKLKNVTIIPFVNKNGYDSPLPKHVFPGRKNGNPTEQLIDNLATHYIYRCDVWIDLHGGAADERLYPFIHIGQTKNEKLRLLTHMILQEFDGERVILDKNGIFPFTRKLEKKGILYIRLEAGERGKVEKKWVDKLVEWVERILSTLLLKTGDPSEGFPAFNHIIEYRSPQNCQWKPSSFRSPHLTKGQNLGVLTLGSKKITLSSKTPGCLLWWKEAGLYKKGEILLGEAAR